MSGFLSRNFSPISLAIVVVALAACAAAATAQPPSPIATAVPPTASRTVPVATPATDPTPSPVASSVAPLASTATPDLPAAGPRSTAIEGVQSQVPSQATPPGTTIGGAPRYLDDRSTPEEVVRSYYNAINRHEYDRAYSYWEPAAAAAKLPPYDQFKQGYADTASVTVTLGKTTTGAAAGNLYFHVPTALVAQTTDGQTQTFVGCYTLHLGQPAIQDLPPFQPMAIQEASLKQVANDADISALLNQVCPAP